jgi:hypothetical protein
MEGEDYLNRIGELAGVVETLPITDEDRKWAADEIKKLAVERRCPKDGCPYVNGPDFSIGNPCRCDEPGDGLGIWRHNT